LSGGITADGVLIDGDTDVVADLFCFRASKADRAQVPEDEVVVSALSLKTITLLVEPGSQYTCVGHDLLGVRFPAGLGDLKEGGRDGGDGVIVGTTLAGRENSVVDTLLEVLGALNVLAEEDESGAGSTEGLVAINSSIPWWNKIGRKRTW
jgi:hypothetical protein